MESVGERLKEALFMRGLSASELSRMTGIERGHISNIITGRIRHPKKNLEKISTALGISEIWLLTGEGNTEHIENEHSIFKLSDEKLETTSIWKTDLLIKDNEKVIEHNNNLLIVSNNLREGYYLFKHNNKLVILYRKESISKIEWFPHEITEEMVSIGLVEAQINKRLIKDEKIKNIRKK